MCGYYGKAPGNMDKEIVAKEAGDAEILDPKIAPGTLVTTTYDECAAEIGDLAQSEEDVLMYALFPNQARTYLSKHRVSEKVDFMLEQESSATKEERLRGHQSDSRAGSALPRRAASERSS